MDNNNGLEKWIREAVASLHDPGNPESTKFFLLGSTALSEVRQLNSYERYEDLSLWGAEDNRPVKGWAEGRLVVEEGGTQCQVECIRVFVDNAKTLYLYNHDTTLSRFFESKQAEEEAAHKVLEELIAEHNEKFGRDYTLVSSELHVKSRAAQDKEEYESIAEQTMNVALRKRLKDKGLVKPAGTWDYELKEELVIKKQRAKSFSNYVFRWKENGEIENIRLRIRGAKECYEYVNTFTVEFVRRTNEGLEIPYQKEITATVPRWRQWLHDSLLKKEQETRKSS